MCRDLGAGALASLLVLGCTGLNPNYADATGGPMESGSGATTDPTTRPDPSSPPGSSSTTAPHTTLEPTRGSSDSSDSTAGVGPGTSGSDSTSEDSGGTTSDVMQGDCSTYDQDCPSGQKCMPWASDGSAWDAVGCFPLEPVDPGEPGESCLVFETATSGLDDCSQTSMCWDVDTRTSVGTCVPFCTGSAAVPVCDDSNHSCVQANEGVIALCLPVCDPLDPQCGVGFGCFPDTGPDADGFACVPDASGAGGAAGDACGFINDCDPGNVCAAGTSLDGCGGSQCCTPLCDLEGGDVCVGVEVCVPYYEEGMAPVGYEQLGFCGIPE